MKVTYLEILVKIIILALVALGGFIAGLPNEEQILQKFLDSSDGKVCVVKQVGLDVIKRCYRLEEVR